MFMNYSLIVSVKLCAKKYPLRSLMKYRRLLNKNYYGAYVFVYEDHALESHTTKCLSGVVWLSNAFDLVVTLDPRSLVRACWCPLP